MYDRNSAKFSRLKEDQEAEEGDAPLRSKESEFERCVVCFARLVQELASEENGPTLTLLCQKALSKIQRCLYYPRSDGGQEVHHCVSRDNAMKMVLVLMLLNENLDPKVSRVKLSMIRAFILALMSHMVTKLLGDMLFFLYGPEGMSEYFDQEAALLETGEEVEVEEDQTRPTSSAEKAAGKKKSRVRDLLRGRRGSNCKFFHF